jgi:hypothetical protein
MRAKEKINSMMMMLPFRTWRFGVLRDELFLKPSLLAQTMHYYTSHYRFFYIFNGCRWIIKPNRLV